MSVLGHSGVAATGSIRSPGVERCMVHYQIGPSGVGHCGKVFEHLGPHGAPLAMPELARPSFASLLLTVMQGGREIGSATGFLVERGNITYLVTNRHVVRGHGGVTPDSLRIAHSLAGELGTWVRVDEVIFDADGRPRWLEHPEHPQAVDVVALPLATTDGIQVFAYDPWHQPSDIAFGVTEPLHIVGFPFGRTGGGFLAIWVRGFIATEPVVDWDGLPCFLIDSRTRQGQSGSPVVAYFAAGASIPKLGGGIALAGGPVERLLGVYSGRINSESDLGIVWKTLTVCDVIDRGQRPSIDSVGMP